MNILLDSNILIYLARDSKQQFLKKYILPTRKDIYVSIVSIAEVKGIALRQKWGIKKQFLLDEIIDKSIVIEVTSLLVNSYVEIDNFSQRTNPNFTEYPFDTPRNMGKNDLWIASTASLLGLELYTTDADFDHLDQVFLDLRKFKQEDFMLNK
jgi:tRNA(fMet)-specific endonuclease VapC